MIINIDIETVPKQGAYPAFLEAAIEGFKAPSSLTKAQAISDLKVFDADQAKAMSKDDAIKLWELEFAEEKSKSTAEHEWRRTALDGSQGEIFSIAWAVEDRAVKTLHREVSKIGEQVIISPEAELIYAFFEELSRDLSKRPPFFVGQNVADFDLKFMFHRCVILGIEPPFKLPFSGRHGADFYDTQQAWAGFKGRISQDNLCRVLGIEGKPGDIDGSKVWDYVSAGEAKKVAGYNADDVEKNRDIYKRLNFIASINAWDKAA